MPSVKSVAVTFFVRVGGCYESLQQAGISHFIEHLCFKGTQRRKTSREISEAIERTGGIINGGTDKELTIYWCRVASEHTALAVDVLHDILMYSRFDAEDIERERSVIIEEINMNYDNPQQHVDTLIYEMLWPGQPIGRDVAGYKETVKSFDRDSLYKFYKAHYLPHNVVVSIAGDIEYNRINDIFGDCSQGWSSREKTKRFKNITDQDGPRVRVDYRDIEEIYLSLGFHGLSIIHPDRFAVDVINIILGEGMSSRLFMELREKHGLVYDIGSNADHFMDTGDITIHSGTDPKHILQAIEVILEQLFLIKSDVKDEEISRAKELMKGRLLLAMENTFSVSNWFGIQDLLTGKILDIDQIFDLVDAVRIEDVKRVAADLLRLDKLNLAVVGPVKNDDKLYKVLRSKSFS